ncbi:hypothetical protein CPY51_29450 [Rhizobium tubonense]|uniref:Uncharacterized protein n=1 Tax=Rhizobium tubonense TaxID=484088 RepID=A0A2W4CBE7_9HYPH|nr:hypothetical protein CPY51_29450 [Rhizobium tubonense]
MSNFHIDHIVPEKLADEPVEFAKVRVDLGLPDDFDLRDYENLLPCVAGANLQKSSALFAKPQVQFFLGIASAKKSRIEDNLRQIKMRSNRGRAIILLQQCLDNGELTAEEVAKILQEQPDEIFRLLEAMSFADSRDLNLIRHADIEVLRNRPVRLGANDHITCLTLTANSGETREVRTCREYDVAISEGFYAATNFDIKMSSWFEHQSGLLRALQAASPPRESFISEPHVGILDLDLMPFSMFPRREKSEEADEVNATYQDKVDDGSIVIKRVRPNLFNIEEAHGMGQQLIEVVRADFNGDGIEDILLFEYCYATHGTLGFGGIRMITRKSATGRFTTIDDDE